VQERERDDPQMTKSPVLGTEDGHGVLF
jgi:hypothetical protein